MNHLLIDFENVQPNNLDKLDDENTHIWLFLGANQQKSISLELCQSLCRFGKNVHFIRIKKTGKNALDFYLSFYLGKITEQDPAALIGILSKDGGYDVLTEHIKDNQLAQNIARITCLDEIQSLPHAKQLEKQQPENDQTTLPAPNNSYSSKDLAAVLRALREPASFLPRLYSNLVNRIQHIILADQWANYSAEMRQENAERLAAALLRKGLISKEADGLIHYHLDADFILNRVQERVLANKASTVEKLSNVIRSSLLSFAIESSAADIQQFIENLVKQNLIKIQQNKISYAPFRQPEKPKAYQPETAAWQKITQLLSKTNRPNKLSGLRNLLKSQEKSLNLKTGETEQIITYLQNKIVFKSTTRKSSIHDPKQPHRPDYRRRNRHRLCAGKKIPRSGQPRDFGRTARRRAAPSRRTTFRQPAR